MRMHATLLTTAFASALLVGGAYAEQPATPAGQPTGSPTSTPTWTVPGAQPNNLTIKQKSSNVKTPETNANARQKPDEHGCIPPAHWDATQAKCVVGVKIKPFDNPSPERMARPIEERGPKGSQPRPVPVPPQNCGPTQPGNPASSTC